MKNDLPNPNPNPNPDLRQVLACLNHKKHLMNPSMKDALWKMYFRLKRNLEPTDQQLEKWLEFRGLELEEAEQPQQDNSDEIEQLKEQVAELENVIRLLIEERIEPMEQELNKNRSNKPELRVIKGSE